MSGESERGIRYVCKMVNGKASKADGIAVFPVYLWVPDGSSLTLTSQSQTLDFFEMPRVHVGSIDICNKRERTQRLDDFELVSQIVASESISISIFICITEK